MIKRLGIKYNIWLILIFISIQSSSQNIFTKKGIWEIILGMYLVQIILNIKIEY